MIFVFSHSAYIWQTITNLSDEMILETLSQTF